MRYITGRMDIPNSIHDNNTEHTTCLLPNQVMLKGVDPTPKVHALDGSWSLIPVL